MMFAPQHYMLAVLSQHAKINKELDAMDTYYMRLLQQIETAEIKSFKNEGRYKKLEGLKQELIDIRFI